MMFSKLARSLSLHFAVCSILQQNACSFERESVFSMDITLMNARDYGNCRAYPEEL